MPNSDAPGLLVRKYGGSSLETVDRIRAVAAELADLHRRGARLVVVVSAMGRTTDELARLARQTHPDPPRRELDMLLTVGERITMSLLSMALAAEGRPAISLTGSQCAIITDTSHTDARIVEVRADRVRRALDAGDIVVVAGFQGVSTEKEITTLGRGGSDTTAVALAAALGARACEILKDVDGVMTADPHLVPEARRYERLDYDELRRMAAAGCGVVHLRAVDYAERHGVRLRVGSSFHAGPGTAIGPAPAAAAASPRPYLPLTMIVRPGIAWLEVAAAGDAAAACRAVLARGGPGDLAAEWLQSDRGWRWAAAGDAGALDGLAERLRREVPGAEVGRQDDLALITIVGGERPSWPQVEERIRAVLADLGVDGWRLRAAGATLRLLVPDASRERCLRPLHEALFPA